MLRKLMKYELQATGRKLLPLYGALILFALLNKFFVIERVINSSVAPDIFIGIISFISVFGYGCIMTAVFVVTFFIIIQRFHKNLLGSEGYLMHTLPLEPYKNITNKLLVSMIWSIVSCFVAGISIIIMIFKPDILNELFNIVIPEVTLSLEMNGYSFSLIIFECTILCLIYTCKIIMRIYASISMGHLFNSKKMLLSFASFIVLNISEIIFNTIYFKILDPLFSLHSLSQPTMNDLTTFCILMAICELITFAVYFFITNYLLKNKLNLE